MKSFLTDSVFLGVVVSLLTYEFCSFFYIIREERLCLYCHAATCFPVNILLEK